MFKVVNILNSFVERYLYDKRTAIGIKLNKYLYPYDDATDCHKITIPSGIEKIINIRKKISYFLVKNNFITI